MVFHPAGVYISITEIQVIKKSLFHQENYAGPFKKKKKSGYVFGTGHLTKVKWSFP